MRGNAKWDLTVTAINFILAFVSKFTLGPHWQMWAFIAIAGFCLAMWVLFPGMWKKYWFKIVVIIIILIVIFASVFMPKPSSPQGVPPPTATQAILISGKSSSVTDVSQSSNIAIKNNSDNPAFNINGGNNQIGNQNIQNNYTLTNSEKIINSFTVEAEIVFSSPSLTNYLNEACLASYVEYPNTIMLSGERIPQITFDVANFKNIESGGHFWEINSASVKMGDFPLGHVVKELGRYTELKIQLNTGDRGVIFNNSVVILDAIKASFFVNDVKEFEFIGRPLSPVKISDNGFVELTSDNFLVPVN